MSAKREREVAKASRLVIEAMGAQGIPLDSCISACAVTMEGLRVLGYRVKMQPVRVRLLNPEGKEELRLGYAAAVGADRYNGHVVLVVDNKLAVDPTIGQVGGPWRIAPGKVGMSAALMFPVDRDFVRGGREDVDADGWTVIYEAFDDDGEWIKGMDGEVARVVRESGRALAGRLRR